jgi:TetR/AcrR family transcriptional regulator, cholesterol catabolism regulator
MDSRERIINEAATLFRTYGIRLVTMDMIAGQMGISKRTIYELFRDKEELLQGVLKWMSEKQRELTEECLKNSENVIEAIFKIMDYMIEHYRKMSPAFRLDMRRYHNDMVRLMKDNEELPYNNIRSILVRGMQEGLFREDLDIEITNKCLSGVTKTSEGDKIELEDGDENVLRDLFINYLRGISTQKGLELISIYDRRNTGKQWNKSE